MTDTLANLQKVLSAQHLTASDLQNIIHKLEDSVPADKFQDAINSVCIYSTDVLTEWLKDHIKSFIDQNNYSYLSIQAKEMDELTSDFSDDYYVLPETLRLRRVSGRS